MTKVRITKISSCEMAHALADYDGLCQNIHGHSYQLHVTVIGSPSQDTSSAKKGMLMDFSDLKQLIENQIVRKFDHALVLNANANSDLLKVLTNNYQNIIISDFQPTSEQLVIHFASILKNALPQGVELYSVKLYETQHSYAEWNREDNLD